MAEKDNVNFKDLGVEDLKTRIKDQQKEINHLSETLKEKNMLLDSLI